MIEFGLEHYDTQTALHIQQPQCERDLLKLLSECDSRRHMRRQVHPQRPPKMTEVRDAHRKPSTSSRESLRTSGFRGTCFKCGQRGHRQIDCQVRHEGVARGAMKSDNAVASSSTIICGFCQKVGHQEDSCWRKRNRPNQVRLLKRCRSLAATPIATVLANGTAQSFTYLIDSGAEVSLISSRVAKQLGKIVLTADRCLLGFGGRNITTNAESDLIAVLPTITLEICFVVVNDSLMPSDIDAIIGWDVIGRNDVCVKKGPGGLELYFDVMTIPRILCVPETKTKSVEFSVSGLAETEVCRLRQLLNDTRSKTPNHIKTGQLRIRLKDDVPVAHRPRRLAYAERVQVQAIVRD